MPPSELRERIEDVIEVMQDFKNRREANRPRSDYVDQLTADMSEYFGYLPELVELFLKMFSPSECLTFLDESDKPRPLVIRTNTLKARRKDLAQALIKRGVNLDPLAKWSKVGLKIYESSIPIGATPEYLAGHYMLQSAASMCPVTALLPLPGERVLDMSSAPGGKTSYLAQLMKNTGLVVANDLKPERQKATVANLHRLGVKNCITCCHDGRKFPKVMGGFDRVLLDAPCSGLGVISRDQSIKIQRTVKDIQKTAHLQKELLLAGIDSVNCKSKTGGYIVYSTCSVSVEENECVVQYALDRRDVKLVETNLSHGKPGFTRYQQRRFHPSMELVRRFYPHTHNMDGFFVAKFKKLSNQEKVGQGEGEGEGMKHDENDMDVDVEEEEEEEEEDSEESVDIDAFIQTVEEEEEKQKQKQKEKGRAARATEDSSDGDRDDGDDDDESEDEEGQDRKDYTTNVVLPEDDESVTSEDEIADDANSTSEEEEEEKPKMKQKAKKTKKMMNGETKKEETKKSKAARKEEEREKEKEKEKEKKKPKAAKEKTKPAKKQKKR